MDIKSNLMIINSWWNNEKINDQFLLGKKRKEFKGV